MSLLSRRVCSLASFFDQMISSIRRYTGSVIVMPPDLSGKP